MREIFFFKILKMFFMICYEKIQIGKLFFLNGLIYVAANEIYYTTDSNQLQLMSCTVFVGLD